MATNRIVEKNKVGVYADVLFDAAKSGGNTEAITVRNQFAQLLKIVYADLDLAMILTTSDYSPKEHYKIMKAVLASFPEELAEVVAVMCKNGDGGLLRQVKAAYEEKIQEDLGLCIVDVTTAVELDDPLRDLIKQKVETDLGLKSYLNESIDKSILGGIIMSVNGRRIDASVLSQLNRARNTLKAIDGGDSQ